MTPGASGPTTSDPGRDSDRIELRGLHVVGIVGVLPEERERAQPLEIDVDVIVDLAAAAASDALVDTVDYGAICDALAATVERERPQLLERLAVVMCEQVLAVDPQVRSATVTVRKLRPPVPHQLASSGVRATRHRQTAPDRRATPNREG